MTIHSAKSPASTANIQASLREAMHQVESAILNAVKSEVNVLDDASKHILQAGGKRVRPRLLMLMYMASGGDDFKLAARPAAAVELMHTASVVHDDINDHGVMRRGRPSVNSIWGRTFALLTGDFLFTTVYKLMAPYGDLNIILADAATALVEGETLQAQAVKDKNFTSEVYSRIIGLKTAALFQAAAEIGARLAGSDSETVYAVRDAGYNIGLAFQIVDDILDIVGDSDMLGKTSGIDLAQGRGIGTVLMTNGNGHTNGEATSKVPANDDISGMIKRKLLEGDRLDQAWQQARMLVDMAVARLDVLPPSDAKDAIIDLAYQVINRES